LTGVLPDPLFSVPTGTICRRVLPLLGRGWLIPSFLRLTRSGALGEFGSWSFPGLPELIVQRVSLGTCCRPPLPSLLPPGVSFLAGFPYHGATTERGIWIRRPPSPTHTFWFRLIRKVFWWARLQISPHVPVEFGLCTSVSPLEKLSVSAARHRPCTNLTLLLWTF